jgi:diguanylate cyclase (GGDEF)-like protein
MKPMIESYKFLKQIVDSILEHIVVIDREGRIVFFNKAWVAFAQQNTHQAEQEWKDFNYLSVCDNAAAGGDEFGAKAGAGIRQVMRNELQSFYFEYPCHAPDKKRWFMMRVSPLQWEENSYFVIAHQDITERKLSEETAFKQSRIDGLTNVANRRYFDEFLHAEWRRCSRLQLPISLAILDLDHFKMINDRYGHQAGDECLIGIGAALNRFSQRPGDLLARYGGEEFAIVFANTRMEQALAVIQNVVEAIAELNIPNQDSPVKPTLTVSIGLAMVIPDTKSNEQDLIRLADQRLYAAKEGGRDRIVSE